MRLALVGAGVLGKTILHHSMEQESLDVVGFFDDTVEGEVEGVQIIGGIDDIVPCYESNLFDCLLITIGYNHLESRMRIFEDLSSKNIPFGKSIHPSAIITSRARVKEGCMIFPGSIIGDGAEIRENTIINAGCNVSHDSIVGEHCFFGPGVVISGFVQIGNCSFIGSGTVVKDNVSLGPSTQTGAGSVVVGSHSGNCLLVGIPAKQK